MYSTKILTISNEHKEILITSTVLNILTIAGTGRCGLLRRRWKRRRCRRCRCGRRRRRRGRVGLLLVAAPPAVLYGPRLWTGLAFLPWMESLADGRVSQRGRGHAAQLVALRRQHCQGRSAQTRVIL